MNNTNVSIPEIVRFISAIVFSYSKSITERIHEDIACTHLGQNQ